MQDSVFLKLEKFFTKYPIRSFNPGEILIEAGERPPGIFYLKDGMVRQFSITPDGQELTVNQFKPVSFFPMSWAITDYDNKYFFEATKKTETHFAKKEDVLDFLKKNPDVLYDLLTRVYSGMEGILFKLTQFMTHGAMERLVAELTIQAQRFGEPVKNQEIRININELDLAAETGLSRESVSRQIRILKKEGILNYSKNSLVISDFPALLQKIQKN